MFPVIHKRGLSHSLRRVLAWKWNRSKCRYLEGNLMLVFRNSHYFPFKKNQPPNPTFVCQLHDWPEQSLSGMGTWDKVQWSWIKSCFGFCVLSLFATLSRAGCESYVWLLTWLLSSSFSKWVWPLQLLLLSPFPSTPSPKAPCLAQVFVLLGTHSIAFVMQSGQCGVTDHCSYPSSPVWKTGMVVHPSFHPLCVLFI